MNKTLSVNIGGIVFHIEEQAYDRLNRYIDSIRGYFTTADGRDEIIQDIEARLGEMFQERISGGKQVIVDADVEHVIGIMGKPEQFAETAEDLHGAEESHTSYSERRTYRRLYRDPDDRIIGGVCSGFSHYLGIDPLWLRGIFAVSFFAFGSGLLLYIILMIIMPKANTTAEKLEMKGEKVNLSNIKKSVQDEMGAIKSNFENSNIKSGAASFFDAIGDLILGALRIIGKIFAVLFLVIGVIILAAFAMAFLAILGVGSIAVPFAVTELVVEPWQQSLALLSLFLVIGIPVIMIIFTAVRVLFKVKTNNKILNWSALILWCVGIFLAISVIGSIAGEFKTRESNRTEIPIEQPASDTLNLHVTGITEKDYDWYLGDGNHLNLPWNSDNEVDSIRIASVQLDIVKANGNQFELVQMTSSRGKNRKLAYDNARSVKYKVEQSANKLTFDESFVLKAKNKYRGQKVQMILKVPVGKSVYLSDDMHDIIYDIKNVTNTYDGNMVGKTWTMTEKGLECIGCNLSDADEYRRGDDFHIRINEDGVKVNASESDSVKGINLQSDDVNIKINDDGVQIDTKKKK